MPATARATSGMMISNMSLVSRGGRCSTSETNCKSDVVSLHGRSTTRAATGARAARLGDRGRDAGLRRPLGHGQGRRPVGAVRRRRPAARHRAASRGLRQEAHRPRPDGLLRDDRDRSRQRRAVPGDDRDLRPGNPRVHHRLPHPLVAQVWYPAAAAGGSPGRYLGRDEHEAETVAHALAATFGVPSFLLHEAQVATSPAVPETAVADGGFPVVLFSPGSDGNARTQLPEADSLAQRGIASLTVAPPAGPSAARRSPWWPWPASGRPGRAARRPSSPRSPAPGGGAARPARGTRGTSSSRRCRGPPRRGRRRGARPCSPRRAAGPRRARSPRRRRSGRAGTTAAT